MVTLRGGSRNPCRALSFIDLIKRTKYKHESGTAFQGATFGFKKTKFEHIRSSCIAQSGFAYSSLFWENQFSNGLSAVAQGRFHLPLIFLPLSKGLFSFILSVFEYTSNRNYYPHALFWFRLEIIYKTKFQIAVSQFWYMLRTNCTKRTQIGYPPETWAPSKKRKWRGKYSFGYFSWLSTSG